MAYGLYTFKTVGGVLVASNVVSGDVATVGLDAAQQAAIAGVISGTVTFPGRAQFATCADGILFPVPLI